MANIIYALNLDEDGRILSTTFDKFGAEGQPRVTELPDGDMYDYIYSDGQYIYEPLPKPPIPPEPTGESITYDELAEAIRKGVNSFNE